MARAMTSGNPSGYAGTMAVPDGAAIQPRGVAASMARANGSHSTIGSGRTTLPAASACAALT